MRARVKVLSWLPVSLAAAAEALLGLASSLGLDCPALGVRHPNLKDTRLVFQSMFTSVACL